MRLPNVTVGLALLRDGAVDFAVGPMFDAPPDIAFHPLVTYGPMIISRRDHPLAQQKRVTLTTLPSVRSSCRRKSKAPIAS